MKPALLFFLLFSGSLFAQNYNPFPNPNDTLVFANAQDTLRQVKIDSFFTAGAKTTYYLGKEWAAYPDSTQYSHCFFSAQNDGWMGAKIVDSANIITFESNAMSLWIDKNQPLGGSMFLGTFKRLGEIFQIHVALDSMTATGGDSLKHFSFRIDTSGHTVAQNLRFTLGKNSGILAWPDFLDTKFVDRLEFGIYKPENFTRISQSALLTVGDIYDWQVGDEFHYNYQISSQFSSYWGASILKIISRKIVADSLVYEIHYQDSQNSGIPDTIVQSYHYENVFPLSFEGPQLMVIHNQLFHFWNEEAIHINNILNGRDGISLNDTKLSNWVIPVTCYGDRGLGTYLAKHEFAKGIGEIKSESTDYTSPTSYHLRELVYYKKGAETWGTPVTINVGVDEFDERKKLIIFPNPATGVVQFSEPLSAEALLYNSSGVLIKELKRDQPSFDTSDLKPGLYFIKSTLGCGRFVKQ